MAKELKKTIVESEEQRNKLFDEIKKHCISNGLPFPNFNS